MSESAPSESAPSPSAPAASEPLPPDTRPSLGTARLQLRPFGLEDAERVALLANDREIHANTRTFPYPYTREHAVQWLVGQAEGWRKGESVVFALELRETAELVGAVGLSISETHHHAEIGYWLGREYRGRGYCSEAVRAVLAFGFETLGLHRIHAHYLTRNPASGRVMDKAGMKREGLLRQHVRKLGKFEDIQYYGILASEWPPEATAGRE